MKPVTLARIEKEGAAKLKALQDDLRACYVEMYGIRNPWTAWLIRKDSRLAEKRSAEFCGWQEGE